MFGINHLIDVQYNFKTQATLIVSNYFLFVMSKSNSQLIQWFSKAKQQLQLNEEKEKLKQFTKQITDRRTKLEKKTGIHVAAESSMNKKIEEAEKFKKIKDHSMDIKEYCDSLNTDVARGLTEKEAEARLLADGENKLTEKEGMHWALEYLHHMANFFAILLWAGSLLCFIAYALDTTDPSNLYLGIVLVLIVNISTFVEFIQNRKSKALMDSFKNFIPAEITVIRDGVKKSMSAVKLVKGDLVQVDPGKKIPADLRIIQSNGMKVDNSSLTGETELLARTPECTNPDNPLESKNVAFFSTLVREGSGLGIVMFTGDNTFIGQIAGLAMSAEEEETPLNKEINRFIHRLGLAAVCFGIIVLVVGLAIGFKVINALTLAIGITVSNVPNGLLLEVTIALTLTAKKIAKKKVLAKKLQAVETLGCTTCICSDKTGTLTMNKMVAANLWCNGERYKAANRQKQGKNYKYQYDLEDKGFQDLHECAVICSVASFDRSPPTSEQEKINQDKHFTAEEKKQKIADYVKEWNNQLQHMPYLDMPTLGDASESALIKFFQPIEDILQTRNRFPTIKNHEDREMRLLFNSTNKFAFSINQCKTADADLCLFTKGAPEKVWKMCTHININGKSVPKDEKWEKAFQDANKYFGKNGQRVLGFAKCHLPKNKFDHKYDYKIDDVVKPNFPLYAQTFVGAVSLNDPPRDAVPFAVTKCHTAGVKVIMVTGDQPITAAAIARQCNIITEKFTVHQLMENQNISFDQAFIKSNAIVIHGDQITEMTLEDEGKPENQQGKPLERWLSKPEIVFARTSPAQKLIIVKACQKMGHIVAVTGDGVNDSPAIKKADLGISMGITGTDVAKDAASMILLNDDFSNIILGIEEGRKIFDNLKKAIIYIASSQTSEIMPFFVLLVLQIPPPVSTVLVLCIDLGTDLIPAISFAYEDSELGIMTRQPRSTTDHLVTVKLFAQGYGLKGFINYFTCQLAYFIVFNDFGFKPFDLVLKNGIFLLNHAEGDVYNPTSPHFGNSKLTGIKDCNEFTNQSELVDWLYARQSGSDLRMSAVNCVNSAAGPIYSQIFNFTECRLQQISPISNRPVCFSTEAAKYAQSAYFYCNFVGQLFNNINCKTRRESVFTQGMGNLNMFFGMTTQFVIAIILGFIYPINIVFGSRDNVFMHYGVVAVPASLIMFALEQIRKYFIRSLPKDKIGRPNWFERNTLW